MAEELTLSLLGLHLFLFYQLFFKLGPGFYLIDSSCKVICFNPWTLKSYEIKRYFAFVMNSTSGHHKKTCRKWKFQSNSLMQGFNFFSHISPEKHLIRIQSFFFFFNWSFLNSPKIYISPKHKLNKCFKICIHIKKYLF